MKKLPKSLADKIKRIQRTFKNRDNATGLLYNNASDLKKSTKKIVLWGLFVSDEGTFLLRPHVFTTEKARTVKQWHAYFRKNYGKILREGILSGMADRTGKFWRLYRIIGWTQNDNTRLADKPTRKKRNKTKSKGQ